MREKDVAILPIGQPPIRQHCYYLTPNKEKKMTLQIEHFINAYLLQYVIIVITFLLFNLLRHCYMLKQLENGIKC